MMSHAQLAFFADQDVSLCRLTDEDCYMSVGPLFHGNAQFLAVYPASDRGLPGDRAASASAPRNG